MWAAVLLSLAGFGGFLAVDAGSVHRHPRARYLILSTASLLQIAALSIVIARHYSVFLSSPWKRSGFALGVLGAVWTVYTVFIEIPMLQRVTHATLVQTGTYAICRHPAFWGILLFVVGMSLLVPTPSMWGLALLWVVLELALITVQDVCVFPARFPEYRQYREKTPFLIPTQKSLREGWHSYRQLLLAS